VGHDLSFAELRGVIRRIEDTHRARPISRRPLRLEDALDGQVEETDGGPIFSVRRRFAAGHRHGEAVLAPAAAEAAASLHLLARAGSPPISGNRLLYLDTETTGLAGGTGTYVFLVGLGFFDGDAFEVRQYFMRDLDEEPALLAAVGRLLAQFDAVVTYNGGGFDLPLLETRFVLARRRLPEEAFHVDLLPSARRVWSARLEDCRLATLERHVLGLVRQDDLPGWSIPPVYFDYLRRKHPGGLARIFEHNRHDVLSLAALTEWVSRALVRAPLLDAHPEELAGLGRIWEASDMERGLACYRVALERGLPSPWRERLHLRLAAVEKRRARWDEACALWAEAIAGDSSFDPRPWEEIAKVHEHRRRDFAAALAHVEAALERARRHGASEHVVTAFAYRLERLTRRLAPGP
jgi:uncharacterized protein YprB with RNaseH-like and TPR domain